VTRRVPEPVRAALERDFDVRIHDEDGTLERAALLELVRGAEGVVTMLTDRVDAELLDAAGPRLRIVANYAVGLDNVDLDECARRGIEVANTPDVLTETTAELAIAILLALVRRVAEGDRFLRARRPWVWSLTFMLGTGLRGKTMLVVGPGRIGSATARLAEAHGMRVVTAGRGDDLHALLPQADVVSIHCPLTPETRHLFDAAAFRAMKPTAVLVNTARGPIVDEGALVDALEAGEIAGAALDVFEREPEVEPRLLTRDDVVVVPHLGSATEETRVAMGMLCVEALRRVLLGGGAEPPPSTSTVSA
jgi:lactate dehydrogenase-like 2-hydroxyacid dehydrogenase